MPMMTWRIEKLVFTRLTNCSSSMIRPRSYVGRFHHLRLQPPPHYLHIPRPPKRNRTAAASLTRPRQPNHQPLELRPPRQRAVAARVEVELQQPVVEPGEPLAA